MLTEKEKLERKRKRELIGFLIGLVVWRTTTIIINLISGPGLLYSLKMPLLLIGFMGMICWVYYLFRIAIPVLKNMKKKEKDMDAEYERFLFLKSFQYSFFVLFSVQAVLLVVNIFSKIPGGTVIDINISIAAISFPIVCLILDREK